MNSLEALFTKDTNVDFLIDKTIDNIFNISRIKIPSNNKIFFDCFNKIATEIFKYESSNLNNTKESLNILNSIVIEELTNHILKNYNNLFKEEEVKLDTIKENTQIILDKQEDIFKLSLNSDNISFDILNNITKFKILNLHMYNEDYIINETNNKFSFKEKKSSKELYSDIYDIEIDPGNYSKEELLKNLQEKMCIISGTNYICELNTFNNKIIIKNNDSYMIENKLSFNIILENSTILNVLGFNSKSINSFVNELIYISDYPIKLLKRVNLKLNIIIHYNTNSKISIVEPILLDKNDKIYDINKSSQKFTNPINIHSIELDFDGYNHRSFPYNLIIEFTQIN